MATLSIDCGDLACPGPLVQISMAIRRLKAGDTLEVNATDQAFCADVKAWCEMTGNELVELDRLAGRCRALIQKKPG